MMPPYGYYKYKCPYCDQNSKLKIERIISTKTEKLKCLKCGVVMIRTWNGKDYEYKQDTNA